MHLDQPSVHTPRRLQANRFTEHVVDIAAVRVLAQRKWRDRFLKRMRYGHFDREVKGRICTQREARSREAVPIKRKQDSHRYGVWVDIGELPRRYIAEARAQRDKEEARAKRERETPCRNRLCNNKDYLDIFQCKV